MERKLWLSGKTLLMKRILIAVDNGPTAEKVAAAGFEFGKAMQAEIALVSVVDTAFMTSDSGLTPAELTEAVKNNSKEDQQQLIRKIFGEYKVRAFLEDGKASEVILEIAEEWNADVLVLGTHGRTGIAHALMGSVAEKVLRHSEIPVYIIPTR